MILAAAGTDDRERIREYLQEFEQYGVSAQGSDAFRNFEIWRAETAPIQDATFLYIREEDERIIGMVNIRFGLNAFLYHEGGHVGYSIRPSEWRQGYGTELLQEALNFCRFIGLCRVLVICEKENTASARVIQKCGGVLEDEVTGTYSKKRMQRYWIQNE